MDAALEEHLSHHVTWVRPDGGYFFWLKLNDGIDARSLPEKAVDRKVGFQLGELFSSCGGMKDRVRLSFAYYDERDIRDGVARMRLVFA